MPPIPPAALALARDLIMDEEHYESDPYWDGYGHVWSQGYGFCQLQDGQPVTQHSPPMSVAECQALLALKLLDTYLPPVIAACGWPLTSGQIAALGSLSWNAGPGAITKSSIPRLARMGAWSAIRAAMQAFVHNHENRIVPDLVGRRYREGLILMGATFVPGKKTGEPLGIPQRPPTPAVPAHPIPPAPLAMAQLHPAGRQGIVPARPPMQSAAPDPQAGAADRLNDQELIHLGVPN